MFRDDVHVATAADRPAGRRLEGHERELASGLARGERRLGPGPELFLVGWAGERPLPDRRVEGDLGQARDVLEGERLETNLAAREDDGLDADRVHSPMVDARLDSTPNPARVG